jgi:hypothetical protein
MKYLTIATIILSSFLTMYGCQREVNKSSCPTQPVFALDGHKLKEISLSSQETTQSSMISGKESIGYIFSGKKGQKFTYQVKNSNICTWLYSPDNQLLSNNILPQDGQYTIQVENVQGSGTFDIVMSLVNESETAVSPIPTQPSPTHKPSNSDSPKNSPNNLIAQYYQEINNRDYQSAWNKLPITLQENRQIHPQGYQSFVDFYSKLNGIVVNDLALVDGTDFSAEIKADLSCKLKNGNISSLFLRFYLQRNEPDRQWKIDKVKFDPHRNSNCGVD